MYNNALQHLYGSYINNYGIFFQKKLCEDSYILRCSNGKKIPARCYIYNTSVITEHYHEKTILRVFDII